MLFKTVHKVVETCLCPSLITRDFSQQHLLMTATYSETAVKTQKNVDSILKLILPLDFCVHSEKKKVLEQQKKSIDLGFYLNSEDVIVTLPEDKVDKNCLCGAKAEENIYSERVSTSH